MNIAFLLPGHGGKPIGGHKIVYEYANRLIDEEYNVEILYKGGTFAERQFKRNIYALLRFFFIKLTSYYKPYSWFNLNSKIKLKYVWSFKRRHILEKDVVVVTGVETAINASKLNSDSIKWFYFIQGFEDWSVSKEVVIETWQNKKFEKIFISDWLQEKAKEFGVDGAVIYNGFDFNNLYVDKSLSNRNKFVLCTVYHPSHAKGFDDAYEAIKKVKERYPELVVNIFGTTIKPAFLPEWFVYYQKPSLAKIRDIYNSSAIFIAASHSEGWGLTVGEAMLCGCSVVCTNNLGYLIMSKNGETALVSDIKDVNALSLNISRLVEDDILRENLSSNALAYMNRFDINLSYNKFKEFICG